jgi:hypothetical protein
MKLFSSNRRTEKMFNFVKESVDSVIKFDYDVNVEQSRTQQHKV